MLHAVVYTTRTLDRLSEPGKYAAEVREQRRGPGRGLGSSAAMSACVNVGTARAVPIHYLASICTASAAAVSCRVKSCPLCALITRSSFSAGACTQGNAGVLELGASTLAMFSTRSGSATAFTEASTTSVLIKLLSPLYAPVVVVNVANTIGNLAGEYEIELPRRSPLHIASLHAAPLYVRISQDASAWVWAELGRCLTVCAEMSISSRRLVTLRPRAPTRPGPLPRGSRHPPGPPVGRWHRRLGAPPAAGLRVERASRCFGLAVASGGSGHRGAGQRAILGTCVGARVSISETLKPRDG